MIGRRTLLFLLVGAPASTAYAAEPTPGQIVEQADAFRLPPLSASGAVKARLRITDGQGASARIDSVTVWTKETSSLVLITDGDQRGMKFLGTPNGYWLYAPHTRRAIRLTPLQLLRGQASVGDISRLRFAQDYEARFAAPRTAMVEGRDCWALELRAKSPAATYATVRLRVAKDNHAPVDADMILASGRKLKTVQFGAVSQIRGHAAIAASTYVDAINTAKRTTIELLDLQPAAMSAAMFRPEALATDF
ncbi:MAG TPA: outer membrane lipoprotein-sorting protein [Caulobacterales bacterium]|nr:outer membrane lipoprotein-sorting protein [Caulobacterales bacterium]